MSELFVALYTNFDSVSTLRSTLLNGDNTLLAYGDVLSCTLRSFCDAVIYSTLVTGFFLYSQLDGVILLGALNNLVGSFYSSFCSFLDGVVVLMVPL